MTDRRIALLQNFASNTHRLFRKQKRSLSTASVPSERYVFETLFVKNHQDLPRLPIPSLDDTCSRYLRSVEHLCTSPRQFENIKDEVNDFRTSIGPTLHQKVIQKDQHFQSLGESGPAFYFEEAWDDGYLAARCPNPININPFYTLKDHTQPEFQDPSVRLASFIHAAMKWQSSLLNGTLAEERRPACICNLGKQMGSARIPGVNKDTLNLSPTSKHVVFHSNGEYFRLNVLDSSNNVLCMAELTQQIRNIIASERSSKHGIGNFTTMERTRWAKVRTSLENLSNDNAASLRSIDEALLLIDINAVPNFTTDERSRDMLMGNNRWFDKHQVIVHGDGTIGMNFEHSHSDGTTWNRVVHEIWHDMHNKGESSAYGPLPELGVFNGSTAEHLSFTLDDYLTNELSAASEEWEATRNNVDLKSMVFSEFGKNEIKKMKMSPDAVGQIAFQLSYMKLHGYPAPVYESCSTRGYFRGRTETIRSSSDAMYQFTKAMASGGDQSTCRELMYMAANRHVELAKEAVVGNGVDRHLMAMKLVATEEDTVHDIALFNNEMYSYSSDFLISSSNVTSPELSIFGFGATSHKGYGIGYQILEDKIPICITSYHDAPDTHSQKYIESIEESLYEIKKLALM